MFAGWMEPKALHDEFEGFLHAKPYRFRFPIRSRH
jgi:hypothetical protein